MHLQFSFLFILFLFYLQQVALENGLLLVDTKYEFGKGPDGKILLVDEVIFFSTLLLLAILDISIIILFLFFCLSVPVCYLLSSQ